MGYFLHTFILFALLAGSSCSNQIHNLRSSISASTNTDIIAPFITSVTAPTAGTYGLGAALDFHIYFSEPVISTDALSVVSIRVGATTRTATYLSGSGTSDWVYRYVVQSTEVDSDGVEILPSAVSLASGAPLKDLAGNTAVLSYPTLPNTASLLVNANIPSITTVSGPANGNYRAGMNLDFTVTFSENITTTGSPRLVLDIGGVTRYATYLSGSGTTTAIYRYTVAGGDTDTDGISVASPLTLNSGTLVNAATTPVALAFSPPTLTGVFIDTTAPTLTSVTAPASTTYVSGQNLDFVATFSEAVTAGTSTRLTLDVGGTTRYAVYSSGNGTTTLTYRYTVVVADNDLDGIGLTATLDLNSQSVVDNAGNALASAAFSAPITAGVIVNNAAVTISSITPPSNATYLVTQDLDFVAHFSGVVTVTGSPRLAVTVGSTTRYAVYQSGSGSADLLFRYTVPAGDEDLDGVATLSPLQLNGGTIQSAGTAAALSFTSPTTTSVLVDARAPTITSVAPVANATYRTGQFLDFNVNFSEPVTASTTTSQLTLNIGGATQYAAYVGGSGTNSFLYRYVVQAGDTDTDGIAISSPLDANGALLRDAVLQSATLTFTPPTTTGILVDTTAPTLLSVTPPSNATYRYGENLDYILNWSEAVVVTGAPYLSITVGVTSRTLTYVSGSGTATQTYRYTVPNGDVDSNGVVLASPMSVGTGTLRDAGGNDAALTFTPTATPLVLVDGAQVSIISVSVPANGSYKAGTNLDFTALFNHSVNVSSSTRLTLTIGSSTVYATYVSGTGTSSILYRYTVQSGDTDTNGIALASPVDLNAGTITDAVTAQSAILTFTPANTASVLVDTTAPTLVSVAAPANGTYTYGQVLDFTATFSEAVTAGAATRLTLDIGGTTRYATYSSGNGSTILHYQYAIASGETDANGIGITASIDLNSSTIRDAATNDLASAAFTAPTTTGVLVDSAPPAITSVSPPANGSYKAGVNLDYTVNFNRVVNLGGTPRLSLNIGGVTRYASYVSGTGTTAALFRYVVQAGEDDTDGVVLSSPVDLNGGSIADGASQNATLTFTAPSTPLLLVDTTTPTIVSVAAPANGTYVYADNLDFVVTFSEAVNSSAATRIALTIGATTRYATYYSGSGTTTLTYRYTIAANETDTDGIAVASPLQLNAGTLADLATNTVSPLTFTPPTTTGVLVDSSQALISSVAPPADGSYLLGANLDFTATFTKAVTVTGSRIAITVGAATRYATYLSGSGTTSIIYRYTVGAGENDTNGIVLTSPVDLNGGSITSAGSQNAVLTFTLPTTTGVLVDTTFPTLVSVTAPANGSYKEAATLDFTATFSEAVNVSGTRLTLDVGGATKYATYQSGSGTSAIIYRYTVGAGDTDTNGVALTASIDLNSGTIADLAGNAPAALTFTAPNTTAVVVDTTAPSLVSVTGPANATYAAGQNLNFIATFSEATLSSAATRIAITIGSTTRYATYFSGSGTTTLTYRYTVVGADADADGIAVASPIDLNGGTLRDAATNDATPLTFTPPTTTGVLVLTNPPTITSVTATNGSYRATQNINLVANFSSAVTITGTPRILLDVGGSALYATYFSGSGTTAITFRYTVAAAQNDTDGITLTSPIDLNSGTIRDGSSVDATLTYTLPNTTAVLVDTTAPTITSITPPADGTYANPQNLDFTVVFSEPVSKSGTPSLRMTIGATTRNATTQVSGNGTNTWVMRYAINAADADSDGIAILAAVFNNPTTILDAAGNSLSTTFTAPSTPGIIVTVPQRVIGGNLSGLPSSASGLKLRNNGGDEITLNAVGTIAFPTTLANGTAYTITISQQPTSSTCVLYAGATGTASATSYKGLQVNCYTDARCLTAPSSTPSGYQSGTGTLANPWLICNPTQFAQLSTYNASDVAGTYYSLAEDINYSNSAITPPYAAGLYATFLGNNKTISDLTSDAAIFDYVYGNIYDLKFVHAVITGGSGYSAVVARNLYGSGIIQNVDIDSTSTLTITSGSLGSIAVYINNNSAVKNCSSAATITCSNSTCAGLVGYMYNGGTAIERSHFTGTITSVGNAYGITAGSGYSGSRVRDSYSTGTINASGSNAEIGGIAGSVGIERSYSKMTLNNTGTGSAYAAGIAPNPYYVADIYSTGAITGPLSYGLMYTNNSTYAVSNGYSIAPLSGATRRAVADNIFSATALYALNQGDAAGVGTLKTAAELKSQTAAAMTTAGVFSGWVFAPLYKGRWRTIPSSYPDIVFDLDWTNLAVRYWQNFKEELTLVGAYGTSASPTFTTFGSTGGAGSQDYAGGVLAANTTDKKGYIYVIPHNATSVKKIDPAAGTVSTLAGSTTGKGVLTGGILTSTGKVVAITENGSTILSIDTTTDAITVSTTDANISAGTYHGGVLSPQGMVYWAPAGANKILKLNPTTNVTTLLTYDFGSAASKYSGAVLAPNGMIYFIPQQASQVAKLDPSTDTVTLIGSALPDGTQNKYSGGALGPNGRIYAMPAEATTVLKIDPTTDTVSQIANTAVIGVTDSTDSKWKGSVLAGNGKIYGIPYDATDVIEFDTTSETFIRFGSFGMTVPGMYEGGVLAPNGKIYGIPYNATDFLEIDPKTILNMSMEVPLSGYFNKY